MVQQYNDPIGGSASTIGSQLEDFYFQKKALIEAAKEQYFMQMADVTSMPKHFGKTIKRFHYLPLLDDANVNDQGIDANGATTNYKATLAFVPPGVTESTNGENVVWVIGEGAGSAAALTAAKTQANLVGEFAHEGYDISAVWNTDYATTVVALQALGWRVADDANDEIPAFPYKAPVFDGGNLYGSSKDVGLIDGKLPVISEVGGRKNRVGFRRVELQGSIQKYGFFDEYTQEMLDFDSDADLSMHINREMVNAASQMTEAKLQIDLLNSAGVVRYAGAATTDSELSGETGGVTAPTYNDLMRLSIDLDENRCPKNTTMITGTRMIDTKTIYGARYMYIGSELIPTVKKMKDIFDTDPAFIPVHKYADAGTVARGEIGSIDEFRIIVVPEMLHWAGQGAAVSTNDGYRETGGNYDIYPMLVVGSESFTTIGFQTDGKSVKFKIKHVKPGSTQSYNFQDPYGELGFMSIKWYYGYMVLRPERIGLIKCVAEW